MRYKMRYNLIIVATLILATGMISVGAHATPSTTYWTPCVIDFQAPGVTHITLDNYVNRYESFATDYGLTFGSKLSGKLQAEYGFDVFYGGTTALAPPNPLFFNAKIGYPEGTISKKAPAVQLGFFNFGVKQGLTNQDVVHLIVGKSLPDGKTRLHASVYIGNAGVLKDSSGNTHNTGVMVACDHVLVPGKNYSKVVLAGDYCSGKNIIGGGGVGVYYYFTKDIDLLVGPVWFNDEGINGSTKFTSQLDINF